jgi:hypothetical protein
MAEMKEQELAKGLVVAPQQSKEESSIKCTEIKIMPLIEEPCAKWVKRESEAIKCQHFNSLGSLS